MLILSRKIQEQILIPGLNIRVTVLSVGAKRVQLGIEAPQGIQITRPDVGKRPVTACEPQNPDVKRHELTGYSRV